MSTIKKVAIASASALTLLPLAAFAVPSLPGSTPTPVSTISDVAQVMRNVVTALQIILFAAAAIFIVLAAYTYLTAGGDEEKIRSARDKIIYAAVAILVALIAMGVAAVVGQIVGANIPT